MVSGYHFAASDTLLSKFLSDTIFFIFLFTNPKALKKHLCTTDDTKRNPVGLQKKFFRDTQQGKLLGRGF